MIHCPAKGLLQWTEDSSSMLQNLVVLPKRDMPVGAGQAGISLLSQLSKLLDILFLKRLDNFISKNNILSNNQDVFRKGRSTAMVLLHVIDEISTCLDNKQFVFVFLQYTIKFFYLNYIIMASQD